jgi:FixJ family two-component response regulator
MRTKPLALVLDDDELFRKMMEKVLDRLGFTVRTVANVPDFDAADITLKPDLYLIDLNIGEARGIDVVERKRKHDTEVPILVISGERDSSVIAHALELGANDYIRKPFNRTLLAAKLGQIMRTAEIEEAERLLETDTRSVYPAKILFDSQITSVDELGMGFRSPHLLPKGSVVRLAGPIITELGGTADIMICVTATSLRADGAYDIHAEFETTSADFLQSVRRWLAKTLSRKPA